MGVLIQERRGERVQSFIVGQYLECEREGERTVMPSRRVTGPDALALTLGASNGTADTRRWLSRRNTHVIHHVYVQYLQARRLVHRCSTQSASPEPSSDLKLDLQHTMSAQH